MSLWLSLNFLTISTLKGTKNRVTFLFKTYPQNADGIAHSTQYTEIYFRIY